MYKKVMMEIMIRRTNILPFKKCFKEKFLGIAKNNERLLENFDEIFEKIS